MKNKIDIKNKSEGDLHTMRREADVALQKFRFAIAGSKTKNVREGRDLRRQIARINTALNQQHA